MKSFKLITCRIFGAIEAALGSNETIAQVSSRIYCCEATHTVTSPSPKNVVHPRRRPVSIRRRVIASGPRAESDDRGAGALRSARFLETSSAPWRATYVPQSAPPEAPARSHKRFGSRDA